MFIKIKTIFIILLLFIAIAIFFHTNTLEISHHSFSFSSGINVIKIAHISDLHSDTIGELENSLFDALEKEKPDIIVITGDLATPNGNIEGYKKLLSHLRAPKGVYFIPGNWEYWEPIEALNDILRDNKIINLSNKTHAVDNDLLLIGFDDSEEGNPDLSLLEKLSNNVTNIALFHSPAFFDSLTGKVQLALAGHSHGGQIRLPLVGAIATPEGTGKYIQGLYKKAHSQLYVSRGIGTSVLPIRLFCPPELAIFEIKY